MAETEGWKNIGIWRAKHENAGCLYGKGVESASEKRRDHRPPLICFENGMLWRNAEMAKSRPIKPRATIEEIKKPIVKRVVDPRISAVAEDTAARYGDVIHVTNHLAQHCQRILTGESTEYAFENPEMRDYRDALATGLAQIDKEKLLPESSYKAVEREIMPKPERQDNQNNRERCITLQMAITQLGDAVKKKIEEAVRAEIEKTKSIPPDIETGMQNKGKIPLNFIEENGCYHWVINKKKLPELSRGILTDISKILFQNMGLGFIPHETFCIQFGKPQGSQEYRRWITQHVSRLRKYGVPVENKPEGVGFPEKYVKSNISLTEK